MGSEARFIRIRKLPCNCYEVQGAQWVHDLLFRTKLFCTNDEEPVAEIGEWQIVHVEGTVEPYHIYDRAHWFRGADISAADADGFKSAPVINGVLSAYGPEMTLDTEEKCAIAFLWLRAAGWDTDRARAVYRKRGWEV